MRSCPNCGREIADEADVCIHCGCDVEKKQKENYLEVRKFVSHANTTLVFGILAAVCCLGIGIVFSIVVWIMDRAVVAPQSPSLPSHEQGMAYAATRKIELAKCLAVLPLIALAICFFIILFRVMFASN